MDKKRRENNVSEKVDYKKKWFAAMVPTNNYESCGIRYNKYQFLNSHGNGNFEHYSFDGLYVGITDVQLANNFKLETVNAPDTIELSFLIEGEQIIKIGGINNDLIYESQECYLINISNLKTSIIYHQKKRLKEIKIRLNAAFLKKHRINEAFDILENYAVPKFNDNFSKPLCVKTQEILAEILSDKRSGLLKRLFLESKTLELIALQLDNKTKKETFPSHHSDNLVKKLYKVQHFIVSDLTVQYSIQELAKEVGLNDFVLKKEFKRIFNQTIFEYANTTRMEKAKQLLQHTNKPVYEISDLIGYRNATHFSAAFKKIEKLTPKKYRDAKKGKG